MVAITTQVKVAADLLTGLSVTAVAKKHSLSRPTVRLIRAKFSDAKTTGEELQEAANRNRADIDLLLMELLEAGLRAQIAILQAASDANYLHRQRARELAKLLSTVSDAFFKTVAILRERGY